MKIKQDELMKQLLEAGVHFGHQTKKWNPKMKPFIFGERNGIYIIDLQKTTERIMKAAEFLRDTVSKGGYVLFVGTKRQAQEIIKPEAIRCGMFYVNQRWLGGLLTNFQTVRKSIRRMKELERMKEDGTLKNYSKKEAAQLTREMNKLKKNLEGVRDMDAIPSAIFIIDSKNEEIAVKEAKKLGVPVVALVDTNCDPDVIDFPIPGNDDAIKAIKLVVSIITDTIADGREHFKKGEAEIQAAKEEEFAKEIASEAIVEKLIGGDIDQEAGKEKFTKAKKKPKPGSGEERKTKKR